MKSNPLVLQTTSNSKLQSSCWRKLLRKLERELKAASLLSEDREALAEAEAERKRKPLALTIRTKNVFPGFDRQTDRPLGRLQPNEEAAIASLHSSTVSALFPTDRAKLRYTYSQGTTHSTFTFYAD